MSDTLGDMIDKLTIANIRLWKLEDSRRDFCQTDESKSEEEVKTFLNKISATNKERNSLIDEINASVRVLIETAAGQEAALRLSADTILGSGKNKFYKTEDT